MNDSPELTAAVKSCTQDLIAQQVISAEAVRPHEHIITSELASKYAERSGVKIPGLLVTDMEGAIPNTDASIIFPLQEEVSIPIPCSPSGSFISLHANKNSGLLKGT